MANQIPLAYADVELQISTSISIGATSFSVVSANDDDGNALPAGKYCFTVDNGTSNKEYLLGQLNGTNVTSVKSVSRQGVESTGAVRAHRVGSSCILTDFATIQRVADILRGQIDLDGSAPVGYDTEPTLADRKDLATVGYVIDTAAGGTVAFDSQTIAGNGGEAIVAGNLVYFKTSDQEWYKTDADTAATVEGVQLGIALGTGSDGVAITGGIQISGTYTTTGLTAGSLYYASNTAGAIANSAGTTTQVIGIALSTTKLLIIPRNPRNPTSRQEDASAGGGAFGTPSASNKFVTQDKLATAITFGTTVNSGTTTRVANVSGTQTIAHGLGVAPTFVSIKASAFNTGSNNNAQFSIGEWYAGDKTSFIAADSREGSSTAQPEWFYPIAGTTEIVRLVTDGADSDWLSGTISVDATNITITWTSNGSPIATTFNIAWLATVNVLSIS